MIRFSTWLIKKGIELWFFSYCVGISSKFFEEEYTKGTSELLKIVKNRLNETNE